MNTNDASLPNYVRAEAVKVRPDLDLMSDLLAGTRRIWERARAANYLRKWKDEAEDVYKIRSEGETVFEGLGRVLSACVGMLFAKPPAIVWNASELAMVEHWQDLDGQGTAGPVLCKRFSDRSIRDGLGVILVDHTPAPDGVVITQENEAALGLRPTWALYSRSQIENWLPGKVNNKTTIVQITFEECGVEPDGAYGVKQVTRHRTLRLLPNPEGGQMATWELKEETKEAGIGGFKVVGEGTYRNRAGQVSEILPIAIAYTGRTDAPCCATIPLLGVGWANLSHWRLSTALTFAREVAAYAQGVIVGELAKEELGNGVTRPGRVRLGPLALIHLVGEGASFEWKAPPVEAFGALERGMLEKLQQIGQMGLSFMVTDTRAAETATAKQLDAAAENSTLATAGQGIEDAWNLALELHAWYLGIEKAGAPVMTINKDFESVVMDAQTMTAWATVAEKLGLPLMVVLEALQKGGRIAADADLEGIAEEAMANQAAVADQQASEAAMLADANNQQQMPPAKRMPALPAAA